MGSRLGQLETCLEIPAMRFHQWGFINEVLSALFRWIKLVLFPLFFWALLVLFPSVQGWIPLCSGAAGWEEQSLWVPGLGSDGADGHRIWAAPAGFGCSVWAGINLLLCAVSNFSSSAFVTSCRVSRDRIDPGKDISVIFPLTVQLRDLAFLTRGKD